jgi:hypothetical protein
MPKTQPTTGSIRTSEAFPVEQRGAAIGMWGAIAGVGIGMVFPTVANAVLGSVPLAEAGVASDDTVLGGYSLINADDLDAAIAIAQGCPHIAAHRRGRRRRSWCAHAAGPPNALAGDRRERALGPPNPALGETSPVRSREPDDAAEAMARVAAQRDRRLARIKRLAEPVQAQARIDYQHRQGERNDRSQDRNS